MLRTLTISVLATLFLATAAADGGADELQIDAYAGKVVIVDFWASWCVPCRRSFPWMNEMVAKYTDQGLVVIAVNLDKEPEAADAFLSEVPADFEIRFDPDASLAAGHRRAVHPRHRGRIDSRRRSLRPSSAVSAH